MADTDTKFTLSLKELAGVAIFLVTLGISIGGYLSVIGEIKGLSADVEEVSKDVSDLKVSNGKLEVILERIESKGK